MAKITRVQVEIGKTYLRRNGERVTIEADTGRRGRYRMQGMDDRGRITWCSLAGRFTSHPDENDLVLELGTVQLPGHGASTRGDI